MLVIATVSTKEMHVSFRLVSSCKYQVGAMASQLSSSLGGQVASPSLLSSINLLMSLQEACKKKLGPLKENNRVTGTVFFFIVLRSNHFLLLLTVKILYKLRCQPTRRLKFSTFSQ